MLTMRLFFRTMVMSIRCTMIRGTGVANTRCKAHVIVPVTLIYFSFPKILDLLLSNGVLKFL
jgi:hypothetical protein